MGVVWDQPTVVNISRDVACALNYLHLWRPHPILHRDISSPNVLLEGVVGRKWKAKLSDFGSANIQFQTSTKMPGNPCYAPPEAGQPRDHSPAMDVYSYGVLVMEMCVHRPPGLTVPDKQRQIDSISWSTMKALVVRCVNEDRHQRPSISDVLAQLANIKIIVPCSFSCMLIVCVVYIIFVVIVSYFCLSVVVCSTCLYFK